jgi:hypothetical protein
VIEIAALSVQELAWIGRQAEIGTLEAVRLMYAGLSAGVEALQLLQSLDLAHNNISHSSGLSSLRLLPRLRRLNLTSNRLGARTVDTHTYLSIVHGTVDVPEVDGSSQVLQRVLGGLAGLKLNYLDLRGNEICRVDGCERYLRAIFPGTAIDF